MSKETKHTPLPWELAAESGVGMISSGNNAIVDFDWYDDNKLENAILIVRAVNAHAKLESERDALRKALKKIGVCGCAAQTGRGHFCGRRARIAQAVLSKYPEKKE